MDTNEKKPRIPGWLIGLSAFVVIVLFFGYGIYRHEWEGGVTRLMTRVIPYPAAMVDGTMIKYATFKEDARILKDFYAREKEKAPVGSQFLTEEEIEARVLDRLIKEVLAEKLAVRYGIRVSNDEVDDAYENNILDQAAVQNPADKTKAVVRAEQTLDQLYGMSSSQFKSKILKPFLVRQALEKAIRDDEELNTDKRKKAEEALIAVRDGMDFGEAVMLYSEDPSMVNTGGEKLQMGRGLLPPEVEEEVFSIEPREGGVLTGVIESDLGYHIILVLDRQEERGYVTNVSFQEILVRHISLDDYLEAQKRRAKILLFVHARDDLT